jgi:inositol transporter-like SP family MFS transporter
MADNEPSVWRKTIIASMTNYIDAGSIVAGGAGLVLWVKYLGMSNLQIGLLGAFSSNAISAAVGALIGGFICDRYGRKVVYTYDLLFYMLGMLGIVFATSFSMLFGGYIIVGLAVGADIVASWTLIAENAPAENRAKHCGSAQVAWALGPAVVLILSVLFGDLGLLGNRLVFGHLIIVAFITWILRLKMPESDSWVANKAKEKELIEQGKLEKVGMKDLFSATNFKTLCFLLGVYLIWNLCAGTMGFFMPFIYQTVGGVDGTTANMLQCGLFLISAVATYSIFMSWGDRISRRLIYGVVGSLFIGSWAIFLLPAESIGINMLIVFVILTGINNGAGQQAFYQLWASELFPTRYRASAQGFMFFAVRISLGIWSVFVPIIMGMYGFKMAAIIMVGFAVISMLIGTIFTPNTAGKTLEQIERERYGDVADRKVTDDHTPDISLSH